MGTLEGIASFAKTSTDYLIGYKSGELAKLNILNSHVFKYYMSPTGVFHDYPVPNNPTDHARINSKKVSDYDPQPFQYSVLEDTPNSYNVYTNKIIIRFDKNKGTMTVQDMRTSKVVIKETAPLSYINNEAKQTLYQHDDEYFFGGGMQNGRFTHKGQEIEIVNSNKWIDEGVTSPCPFYWSTNGYGILRNTWQQGIYDFGSKIPNIVETTHQTEEFDAFFFINPLPRDILNDYYELTGRPIFMPEYAFYESHLNAFNRDYWVKVDNKTPEAILFEDGYYYKCYQPKDMNGKEGVLESLNGEKNNYQFSARAMIARYQKHDMPLGWFVPNDGYGCGYGQTDSLEGDIENLKHFTQYAKEQGVEVGLWTESNLEPKDPNNPKKGERDLTTEVSVAGVVALKCDVAWIGAGYSFGLNAVEHAAKLFVKGAHQAARLMIIMVDGWAGTQRYAGIWSGDQTGGQWEYIRFHIPTYIGSGLSGIPVVGSDMDGIYGGKLREVHIRDYQWKTFTPLQLNMDGWGKLQKTPFVFGGEANRINRAYLKLKSMLMPYNYSIAFESTNGLPMIRAMFLVFPKEECAYTKDSQYQYMWGPFILVAPVYKELRTKTDLIQNEVYLPDPNQVWIDMFTGEKYQGGKIWNHLKTPLWKCPVFIKEGAIIPMTNPNNNPHEIKRDLRIFTIYPNGTTAFEVYEDDGITANYLHGHSATTRVFVHGPPSNEHGDLVIQVHKTVGSYRGMVKERSTLLQIMTTKPIDHIKAAIDGKSLTIPKVENEEEFAASDTAYFLHNEFVLNPYLRELGEEAVLQPFLLIKIHKIDVTSNVLHVKVADYENKGKVAGSNTKLNFSLRVPNNFTVNDEEITPTGLTLRWEPIKDVYYEIERDGVVFTNITDKQFTFDGFEYDSEHKFRIRTANDEGVSKWSYYIIVKTKENPQKNAVKNVKVNCNIPCQPFQEVCKLTDCKAATMWHTHWAKPDMANPQKGKVIKLDFDLGDVYGIDRIEYTPRDDAGNGTILQIQYRYSVDNKIWTPMSNKIKWEHDELPKNITLHGERMRYVEINILDSIGGFGSGRTIMFYKYV